MPIKFQQQYFMLFSLLIVDVVDQDSFSVLKSKNAAVRIIFCTRNEIWRKLLVRREGFRTFVFVSISVQNFKDRNRHCFGFI